MKQLHLKLLLLSNIFFIGALNASGLGQEEAAEVPSLTPTRTEIVHEGGNEGPAPHALVRQGAALHLASAPDPVAGASTRSATTTVLVTDDPDATLPLEADGDGGGEVIDPAAAAPAAGPDTSRSTDTDSSHDGIYRSDEDNGDDYFAPIPSRAPTPTPTPTPEATGDQP